MHKMACIGFASRRDGCPPLNDAAGLPARRRRRRSASYAGAAGASQCTWPFEKYTSAPRVTCVARM